MVSTAMGGKEASLLRGFIFLPPVLLGPSPSCPKEFDTQRGLDTLSGVKERRPIWAGLGPDHEPRFFLQDSATCVLKAQGLKEVTAYILLSHL